MKGRKPTPSHLKLIRGARDTVNHRTINKAEPTPVAKRPAAPKWLNERARAIFRQLVKRIAEMGYCSASHTEALALAACRLEEVEHLTAVIDREGHTYSVTGVSGERLIKPRPEVGQRSSAIRQAQSLLSEFGLSPAAATRVVVPGKQRRNAFDDL